MPKSNITTQVASEYPNGYGAQAIRSAAFHTPDQAQCEDFPRWTVVPCLRYIQLDARA